MNMKRIRWSSITLIASSSSVINNINNVVVNAQTNNNLRHIVLDPKTVELKSDASSSSSSIQYNPTPDQQQFGNKYLQQLKYAEPTIAHSRPLLAPSSSSTTTATVDVVTIGSQTRPLLITTQQTTWASNARNFYGFTEANDYDPNCAVIMEDYDFRMKYINQCRTYTSRYNKFRTGYGAGHGQQGGWFCAQRRVGRSLGWISAIYTGEQFMTLPDVLMIVDDDTVVDIDKVTSFMQERNPDANVPYIAAGSTTHMGKVRDGFTMTHGGFGTYFNKAALRLLTMPVYCNFDSEEQQQQQTMNELQNAFVSNACKQLQMNRSDELQIYTPGDSIFDLFYKMSSIPYFCFHSDWAMGYMITYYSNTQLNEVEPAGQRRRCYKESLQCHQLGVNEMMDFMVDHPQRGGQGQEMMVQQFQQQEGQDGQMQGQQGEGVQLEEDQWREDNGIEQQGVQQQGNEGGISFGVYQWEEKMKSSESWEESSNDIA
mmetsp:Transcript_32268/g.68271  ORF Transcript_32268/g.68271 Transcript_32268/m.68271 type:complete len:485 (+) Transcript_32268:133-1587(+)